MIRTREAGTLRAEDAGQSVTLAGWIGRRRDHGGVAFLDLRDGSGVAQVVVHDPEVAHPLRNEFCIKVVGQVVASSPNPPISATLAKWGIFPSSTSRRSRLGSRPSSPRASAPATAGSMPWM